MWKAVLAGTTALAIAGSSVVFAQQRPAGTEPEQHWRPSAQDFGALADARITGLKAALQLSREQEKNWSAFEQALRDLAKERVERITDRRNAPRASDPIERMRRRADAMTARADGLKRLADAAQPLYQSLDEGQKHRFAWLMRTMGPHRTAFAHWREHRGQERVR
jgi:zinc resistance-associated protein